MFGASLMAQLVKNLPVTQETGIQSLGREDPLEKEMATHSSSLAWRIPWTEELGRLQFMGPTESDKTVWLTLTFKAIFLKYQLSGKQFSFTPNKLFQIEL